MCSPYVDFVDLSFSTGRCFLNEDGWVVGEVNTTSVGGCILDDVGLGLPIGQRWKRNYKNLVLLVGQV